MRRQRRTRSSVRIHHRIDAGAIDCDQIEKIAAADQQRRTGAVNEMQRRRSRDAAFQDVVNVVRIGADRRIARRFDVGDLRQLVDVRERDVDDDQPRPETGDPQIDCDTPRRQPAGCRSFQRSHIINVVR